MLLGQQPESKGMLVGLPLEFWYSQWACLVGPGYLQLRDIGLKSVWHSGKHWKPCRPFEYE
jgi:hypothetical protein